MKHALKQSSCYTAAHMFKQAFLKINLVTVHSIMSLNAPVTQVGLLSLLRNDILQLMWLAGYNMGTLTNVIR